MKIGKRSIIFGKAEIRRLRGIRIGTNTAIGSSAVLDGWGELEIGNNVTLSTGVWIWTAEHDKNDPYFRTIPAKVIIED